MDGFIQANSGLWGKVDPIDGIPIRPPSPPREGLPEEHSDRDRSIYSETNRGGAFTVRVRIASRLHLVGSFDSIVEAREARDDFREKHRVERREPIPLRDRIWASISRRGSKGTSLAQIRENRGESWSRQNIATAIESLILDGLVEVRMVGRARRYVPLVPYVRPVVERGPTAAEERAALAEQINSLLVDAGSEGVIFDDLADMLPEVSERRVLFAVRLLRRQGRARSESYQVAALKMWTFTRWYHAVAPLSQLAETMLRHLRRRPDGLPESRLWDRCCYSSSRQEFADAMALLERRGLAQFKGYLRGGRWHPVQSADSLTA